MPLIIKGSCAPVIAGVRRSIIKMELPKLNVGILILCLLAPCLPCYGQRRGQPSEPGLITPGRSVGTLHLGDTRERVLELFPKKVADEEYDYAPACPVTEIHWLDPSFDANGLFIFLHSGRVIQIQAETPRFRTREGITEESSPALVRRHYPRIETYVLLNSGAEIVGGRDLIYWIDRHQGITFEFYYDRRARKRRVKSVIVFEPGTEFQPGACEQFKWQWRKLKPFALEAHRGRRA